MTLWPTPCMARYLSWTVAVESCKMVTHPCFTLQTQLHGSATSAANALHENPITVTDLTVYCSCSHQLQDLLLMSRPISTRQISYQRYLVHFTPYSHYARVYSNQSIHRYGLSHHWKLTTLWLSIRVSSSGGGGSPLPPPSRNR